ncbi:BTB/POZ domain-containing protein SR1IP1 isoform X2 [Elaeis guineensis]|uniref:BTB/POZ domain-containing protein SR1IP1 isoform X2 n=1 Tax=Elaeis guineensis var. tenera TaxID=51953 RepID=A0A6I9S7V4_ELAGV|nr:BTB/POZ domain-containing protein SR1IP1 isoform X2 [Elaeis guineensis]
MLGVDHETSPPSAAIKKELLSTTMKRTSEWILSQEVPSDITVHAGGATFALHKFPLISKCGYIRRLVSEANDSNISLIEIPDVPGGAEAFGFAAKFCYGINFEITTENIAMLRCVAEYLEMTEDYVVGNLVSRTEIFLEEVALMSLPDAVTVLHKSEELLPMAEKVKLVSRCIDAVAYIACKDSHICIPSGTENSHGSLYSGLQPKAILDWWAEELTVLRIDTFQRVLMAMKARGFKEYALGPVIMLYAQKSLRGLDIFGRRKKKIEPRKENEKRVVLETVVSLLPGERNAMSVSFLSMLLRAAIYLETTVACRLDLEKRMGLQLEHAVLDDLLIPSFSYNADTKFDVDTVRRIFMNYLEHKVDGSRFSYTMDDGHVSSLPGDIERVGRLMESYLAEIASDHNLTIARFISLADLIPEQSRVIEDGMYRAIDIYLKSHPSLSDMERRKICSLMDSQKLSREACAHVARNDRLPVPIVVQVLYYEQQRLRDVTSGNLIGGESPALSQKATSYGIGYHNAPDELSRLRRENDDLKLELVRLRMQLKEIEKSSGNIAAADKPPLPKKSFIHSISNKLGHLFAFMHSDTVKLLSDKTRRKPPKVLRHSIS